MWDRYSENNIAPTQQCLTEADLDFERTPFMNYYSLSRSHAHEAEVRAYLSYRPAVDF